MQGRCCNRGAWVWGLCGLLAMLLAAPADARLRRVEPGELPALAADEGFLVVAVDADVPLYSVRLTRDGRFFGTGSVRRLPEGRSHVLFRAEAGTYQWTDIELVQGLIYSVRKDPEFRFEVEAGRITYPGDLMFNPGNLWRADIMVSNRGLAALDWMQAAHPALLAGHDFVYSGRYPDPFPAFYREALARHPEARAPDQVALRELADPGALPIRPDVLWRQPRVQEARLSPDGRLLALHVREGRSDWRVEVVDLRNGATHVVSRAPRSFSRMAWSGDGGLVLSIGLSHRQLITVIRVKRGEGDALAFEAVRLPQRGMLVDALDADPDHVLVAFHSRRGELMVHRVDMRSQALADAFRPNFRDRLNRGVANDLAWFADAQGRLRMAVARVGERRVLMHGADGEFREVLDLTSDIGFEPTGLSGDARIVYGITDRERGQRELVAFDVDSGRIEQTLFSRPGVDVHRPILDRDRNAIGVHYYEQGRLVSEYFGETENHLARMISAAFPGMATSVAGRSIDGRQQVLWVDGPDLPPRLFHLDVEARRAQLVIEASPWLEELAFAPTQPVRFAANDGTPLDAFLTLPDRPGPRPLVVFPHGGPIGVADTLHFDPEVQFIASLGFAVLQVNFRGSDGYGRAFREAGHGNFGTGIEDDIDAAIDHVLAHHPLDAGRMCMLGSSYGGYSALVAAVRWPDRFRCAVSINGVSDRVLMFTASDAARTEARRALAEQIVGDPRERMDDMLAVSPLYQFERLTTPVMLVHGRRDVRVDYEHTRRLLRMLDMAGRTPAGLVLVNEGHSFRNASSHHRTWRGIAAFLRQHLDTPGPD